MLLRYLKAQGFVLLCGGLVGPIFLGVYFALGQDGLLKWMFWVGLLVTAADVLIALALTAQSIEADRPPGDVRIALALQNFRRRHDDS